MKILYKSPKYGGFLHPLTCYLTENNAESFCIWSRFNSIDGCTYRFIVILTFAWPKISLNDFKSNPSSTHRVANVCRSVWKLAGEIAQHCNTRLKWFCILLGSTHWCSFPVKKNPDEDSGWIEARSFAKSSGNGITRIECLLFGEVIITFVFWSNGMSAWIRCMVCCTHNTRSCKHIFSQRRAQSSPTRMPVNKHSKIPAFLR